MSRSSSSSRRTGTGRAEACSARPGERDGDGLVVAFPGWLDNWFVPRGYAVAITDSAGMGASEGCQDGTGLSSQAGAVAALDWLSGQSSGTSTTGHEVIAEWSSGSVAMVGKSADALHALMAATTGHPALKAVVPIASLRSEVEAGAPGGLVVPPVLPGGDGRCAAFARQWASDIGDGTGPTDLTRALDVLENLQDYSAATLFAHGLRDLNTRSPMMFALREALADRGVESRLWLHQGGHTDPFDIRPAEWVAEVTAFLDHHLRGAAPPTTPPVKLQRPDLAWTATDDLPAGASSVEFGLGESGLTEGRATATPRVLGTVASPMNAQERYGADPDAEVDLSVFGPGSSQLHHSFDTGPLTADLAIEGEPSVRLWVRQRGEPFGVTGALVARGTGEYTVYTDAFFGQDVTRGIAQCWGAERPPDPGCYPGDGLALEPGNLDILALGAHGIGRDSATEAYVDPGDDWVEVTIPLMRVDTVIPAGHELGLVVTVNEANHTGPGLGRSVVDVGPGTLTLPIP